MQIPIINTSSIKQTDIEQLMQIGFGYVQLADKKLIEKIQQCTHVAREFFKNSPEEKSKWQLKETLNSNDRYQGYALRSQSQNTNAIEQIFFEPDSSFGPFEQHSSLVNEINKYYMDKIFHPILKAIFHHLGISQENCIEAISYPNRSLVFQKCPRIGAQKDIIRLNAHKDFGLLTILFFEEPGLEVKYQQDWQAIPPKEGCVIINLGNAIELMTNKRCHSALHRVTNATDDRISMVYFINPNYQQKVRNLIDDSIISPNGEMFFKQQFSEYYETDH